MNETYSFKIGYYGNLRKPKSQPNDYTSGIAGAVLLGLASPYDQLKNYEIMVGKIHKMKAKGTVRANLAIGLAYTTIKEHENWKSVNGGPLAQNYYWEYQRHNTLSLILNPKIELPFKYYGFTLSPVLQVNKYRTYFGLGFGQMIGLLKRDNNSKEQ